MTRVLGIGDNTVDIYVDRVLQFPGGNAVNIAVLTRRLGASSSYLGCVGKDALGQLVRRSLECEKVDTSHLRILNGTNSWSRIRHRGNDRYFDGSAKNFAGRYDLTADDYDFISGHDVVHSSIYSLLEDDLARIGAAAPIFSYDFSADFDDRYIAATAPHVDIAFLSDAQSDDRGCSALCRRVAACGPSTVVVTRGLKGAVALHGNQFFVSSAIETTVVDTLGAGDGFIAAFLLARHRQCDMSAALARASAYAAEVCSYLGAFGHASAVQPDQSGLVSPEEQRLARASQPNPNS